MDVPRADLKAQYLQIKDEIDQAVGDVLTNTAFVLGPAVERFENAYARHHQAKHCVAMSSGTSALHAGLLALGVRPGDEVIVPVNTFVATAEAVSHCCATPVFVDMRESDYCLDPEAVERAVTDRTRAIIPVHLYGQPADMDDICRVAQAHDLAVLEDCSHAHDAAYRGQAVGTIGNAGAFSFYPSKNLGAFGEAGAVVTNDDGMAEQLRLIRSHGSASEYHHDVVGYNYRMDGLQGAVLEVKLKYLTSWTDRRRRIARRYKEALAGAPLKLPSEKPAIRHAYHLFVIRVKNRDRVLAALEERGVHCGIHYPVPLHLTGAYESLGYKEGDFPVAEAGAKNYISLPMYPELSDDAVEYVVQCLVDVL